MPGGSPRRVMLDVIEGKDPAAERKAERADRDLRRLASQYVELHAKKHNKSWRQAERLVARHLLPRWGKLKASAITRADVGAMMLRIEAPIVANQVLAAASAIFSWAIRQEILTVNPCKLVDRNPTTDRERVLSDEEVALLWPKLDPALQLILLPASGPARSRRCSASTSPTAGGRCRASRRAIGREPRTAGITGSGCRSPRRR